MSGTNKNDNRKEDPSQAQGSHQPALESEGIDANEADSSDDAARLQPAENSSPSNFLAQNHGEQLSNEMPISGPTQGSALPLDEHEFFEGHDISTQASPEIFELGTSTFEDGVAIQPNIGDEAEGSNQPYAAAVENVTRTPMRTPSPPSDDDLDSYLPLLVQAFAADENPLNTQDPDQSIEAGAIKGTDNDQEDSDLDRKPAASGAEMQDFDHIQPDEDEMKDLTTKRARTALHNWYKRLRDLHVFRRNHGHTKVPQKYVYKEKRKLANWVNKQRSEAKAWREGKSSSLTPKKIARLNEVGFEWAKPKDNWDERYQELKQYIEEHGDANVLTKDKKLGRWVSDQRAMYKKYNAGDAHNKLTREEMLRRIQLLEAVGLSWTMVPNSASDGENRDASKKDDGGNDKSDEEGSE